MDPAQARLVQHTALVAITFQLSLLLPTLMHLICCYCMKEPYHTSILSGYAWLQELLQGHPECICTELGVHKDVFHALVRELQSMGHGDTRYMTLEEQLAIFLYTSATGLSMNDKYSSCVGTACAGQVLHLLDTNPYAEWNEYINFGTPIFSFFPQLIHRTLMSMPGFYPWKLHQSHSSIEVLSLFEQQLSLTLHSGHSSYIAIISSRQRTTKACSIGTLQLQQE